ncbi:MAG: hypothetical protein WC536_01035 [Patescibacteria group bacterium]
MSENSKKFDLDLDNLPESSDNFSGLGELVKANSIIPKDIISGTMLSAVKDAAASAAENLKRLGKIEMPQFNFPEPVTYTAIAPDFTKQREEAEIRRLTLEQLRKGKTKKEQIAEPETTNWYSPSSGIGYIKDNPFKFQTDKNLYKIFNKIVLNNGYLSRQELLSELGLSESDANDKTLNNIIINDRIKKIRTRTKLKPVELVNNCGNLSLMVRVNNKDKDHLRP